MTAAFKDAPRMDAGTPDVTERLLGKGSSGAAPAALAVVMISLNEAHHIAAVLENLAGFALEVFLVDSFSSDETVEIALQHGVHVVQRRFRGFGDQWNFAVKQLPITAPWTMKLDPDERLTDALKASIRELIAEDEADGAYVRRRLWFMGRPLPVRQDILRLWRSGTCRFSDVLVNEHPLVDGRCRRIAGEVEHHDSPNLHHWFEKQNNYTTAEALATWRDDPLSAKPRIFGGPLERRMWLKSMAQRAPGTPALMFAYCLLVRGAWRAGAVGWIWARLRGDVFRWRRYKLHEFRRSGVGFAPPSSRLGTPHPGVVQAD